MNTATDGKRTLGAVYRHVEQWRSRKKRAAIHAADLARGRWPSWEPTGSRGSGEPVV
jgi:hypothetical protein